MATTPGFPRPVRDPHSDRPLVTFVTGVTLSDLADRGWLVVLAFTAASLGSPLTATLVIAAGTVPRAVLVLIGGTVADRLPTRPLLIGADVVRALALLAAVAALIGGVVPVLGLMVAVAVLFGAADAIHLPAVGTLPRQLVPEEALVRAAGWRQMGSRFAYLAGPPLAGLALAALPLPETLALLAVPFLLAALVVSRLRPRYPHVVSTSPSVWVAVRELVDHLRHERDARALVLSLVGLNFFTIPVVTVGVALRVTGEGWGPASLGVLLGLVGGGAVVGTLITVRLRPRRPLRLAYGALALSGFALVGIGFAPRWGVGVALAVVGLTSGLACPQLAGMLQAKVDPAYLGRVYSLIALSDDGIMPLALVGFGAVTVAVGLQVTVTVCGLGMVVWMGLAFLRPGLRAMTLADDPTDTPVDRDLPEPISA